MASGKDALYTAPIFLGTAFVLFGLAIAEKILNLFNSSLPVVNVFPRQVLDWAVTLLVFEIALTLRQLVEMRQSRDPEERQATDQGLR